MASSRSKPPAAVSRTRSGGGARVATGGHYSATARRPLILLAGLLTALTGCGGGGASLADDTYFVRFVHLVPAAPDYRVHVAAATAAASGATDLGPVGQLSASQFLRVNAGSTRCVGTIGGDPAPEAVVPGEPGSVYSVRLVGSQRPEEGLPRVTAVVVEEDNNAVPLRESGLRFMHAAAGYGPLDIECHLVRQPSLRIATSLSYGQVVERRGDVAAPVLVTPGTATIIVRETGSNETVTLATLVAEPAVLYDAAVVVAAGRPTIVFW